MTARIRQHIRRMHTMPFTVNAQARIDLIAEHKRRMVEEIMAEAGDREWVVWNTQEAINREDDLIVITMKMEFEE